MIDASPKDELLDESLFTEPPDFRSSTPPASVVTHTLKSGKKLDVRLVGHSPLWGHYIWNGAKLLADYIEDHLDLLQGKDVLELGAGAGLPSLVSAIEGRPRAVVITDYPDDDLISNIKFNIETTVSAKGVFCDPNHRPIIEGRGYLWGQDVDPLLAICNESGNGLEGFDILLLADLNFNHTCHEALADTISLTMRRTKDAKALVFFTPYRPWLLNKDMALFDAIRRKNMTVKRIVEYKMEEVMFKDDPGSEDARRTVYGFEVAWNLDELA